MNPTASGIYRAQHCSASCALPQVNTSSEQAARGTAGHRFLELVGGDQAHEKALEQIPDAHREFCERIELDGLPLGPEFRREVAFAFDVATGSARYIGQGCGRDYGQLSSTEIAGTLDVIGFPGTLEVSIDDYKFDGYESSAPPPEKNPQLLFGALCVSRLTCATSFKLSLIHFRPDGTHWKESAEVDAFDLDAYALDLRALVNQVRAAEDTVYAGKPPPVSRGPWCRYCPAVTSCPPILDMVRAAAADPQQPAEVIRDLLQAAGTGDLAARKKAAAMAFARLKEVEDALKPWKSAIYLFASEQAIELPDGRIYGVVERPVDELDARKMRGLLATRFGPDVAEGACAFETSKAALERALKPILNKQLAHYQEQKDAGVKVKRPAMTALKEGVLAELAQQGGVKKLLKRTVRLHRVSASGEAVVEPSSSEEDVPF